MKSLLLWVLLGLTVGGRLAAAELLPRPPELEPDVQFWIRIYTEIGNNEGVIHDQHQLSVVYETLQFDPAATPHERQLQSDAERTRLAEILHRLARGEAPATPEEQRIKELWGENGTSARLNEAADDMRLQLGQADRFRAGLVRAGAWQKHVADVFAAAGLPAELALLPHVESSFDPAAYSKAGAAGMWQFMPGTARHFLTINSAVDERFDPYRETEAAAALLEKNYQLLGTWPLAITAYNHGAEGMRRACAQMGTQDIVRIVRDYHSPTFGFASRNYYISFLAALTVANDPEHYFGRLDVEAPNPYHELRLTAAVPASALEGALKIDAGVLRSLNPALRPAVWESGLPIPVGYVLRLPPADEQWTPERIEKATADEAKPVILARARVHARARHLHARYLARRASAHRHTS